MIVNQSMSRSLWKFTIPMWCLFCMLVNKFSPYMLLKLVIFEWVRASSSVSNTQFHGDHSFDTSHRGRLKLY